MRRKTPSSRRKRELAERASRLGDAVVAEESGWKKATIAQWRRDRNLPAAGTRTAPQPNEMPASLATAGTGVSNLVLSDDERLLPTVSGLSLEERQELADRPDLRLSVNARKEWEEMNRQPARDLPELREFMEWRSPYINYDDDTTPNSSNS